MSTVYRRGRTPRRPRVHQREKREALGLYPVILATGSVLVTFSAMALGALWLTH